MTKKRTLKGWVVKLLGSVLGGYIFFVATSIDNIGNSNYNTILIIWTMLAIISYCLLSKYSNVFDN